MKEYDDYIEIPERAPGRVEVPSNEETRYWVVWEALFGAQAGEYAALTERDKTVIAQELIEAARELSKWEGKAFRKPVWAGKKHAGEIWQQTADYLTGKRAVGEFVGEAALLIRKEFEHQQVQQQRWVDLRGGICPDPKITQQRLQYFLEWLTQDVKSPEPNHDRMLAGMMAEVIEPANFS